jgi:hypothetical protein
MRVRIRLHSKLRRDTSGGSESHPFAAFDGIVKGDPEGLPRTASSLRLDGVWGNAEDYETATLIAEEFQWKRQGEFDGLGVRWLDTALPFGSLGCLRRRLRPVNLMPSLSHPRVKPRGGRLRLPRTASRLTQLAAALQDGITCSATPTE